MIIGILPYLFGICLAIQLLYCLVFFLRLACYKTPTETNLSLIPIPASIIICAYNEAENLAKNLPSILSQNYPDFEVLVVNDDSNDETNQVLKTIRQSYPQLRIIKMDYSQTERKAGKKQALAEGIHQSKYESLVLTDADCKPASNQWLAVMMNELGSKESLALGYGPYDKEDNWLNRFVRFETLYTAIQYMSFALAGLPYMGVGRNMAYHKYLFEKVGGFSKHDHIASGDDDLFVSGIANQSNTKIVINPKTYMYSPAKSTWRAYFGQKSRHVTTGTHYKPIHQLLLGMLSLSHFGLYILGISSIILGLNAGWITSLLLMAIVTKTIIFSLIARKLGESTLIPFIPILDIIYVLYYILLAPALFLGNTSRWK